MKELLNTAHRGASAYAPENTFAAFDLALALGAQAIELDVRQTRDGVLVVMHDDTIGRTLSGPFAPATPVRSLTWSEIARLDAGTWFNESHASRARPEFSDARVPRLEDVFSRYANDISCFIELKQCVPTTSMEDEIVRLVRRHGVANNVLVGAFSQRSLQRIHGLERSVGLIQLFHSYATSSAIRAYLEALPAYCTGIGPCKSQVEHRLVSAADRSGLGVFTWTVNEPHEMIDLIELGVRGIITDYPDVLDDVQVRAAVSTRPPPFEAAAA